MGKFSLGRKNNIPMKKKECIYLLCLCISRPEKKRGKIAIPTTLPNNPCHMRAKRCRSPPSTKSNSLNLG